MLHPISKQVYKLKLPKKWRIHNAFYISLLKQNITKKRQVNNKQLEFKAGNNEKYKVDSIENRVVYTRESATKQLSRLYYLVLWKGYLKNKNT